MKTAHYPSAVAIIETPDAFLLEGRPEASDGLELAHAGKLQFFGGSVEVGESASAAIVRELQEELDLRLSEDDPVFLWKGWFDRSQNRLGETVRRHVTLFHVAITSSTQLDLKVLGSIQEIPKELKVIEAHKDDLTEFAYEGLRRYLTDKEKTWG